MYYELSTNGFNDPLIFNDDYDYDYYNLRAKEIGEMKNFLSHMAIGRMKASSDYTFQFTVQCKADELRKFDFLHNLNCGGNLTVSPRVVDYFKQNHAQDVAFCNIEIHTSTEVITDYKIMICTSISDISFDQKQSYFINTPQIQRLYNPAFNEGAVPQGRILVHSATFRKLMNEDDALKLKAQNFLGLGLEKVKMAK